MIQFLLFLVTSIICFILVINSTARSSSAIKQIIKKSKISRNQNAKKYEDFLENSADPFLIFQYFNEIKKRLPDNLHNIMLGHCLNYNYFAISYIKALGSDDTADNYFKRKMRVLG